MTVGEKDLIVHVHSTEEFNAAVWADSGLVLVDFYADRCGPCVALAPVMTELATQYEGKVKIVKLDVDQANEIAAQYGVMSIPTVYLFNNGVKIWDPIVGAHPQDSYADILDETLASL